MQARRSQIFVGVVLAIAFAHIAQFPSATAGEFGRFVKNVGKATGSKHLERAGNDLDKAWKKTKKKVTVIEDIQHITTDQMRDTGRWVRENPEQALAIAAVVTVGWAACVDGCTLVAGVVLEGAAAGPAAGAASGIVSIATVELSEESDSGKNIPAIPPPPESLGSTTGVDKSTSVKGPVIRTDEPASLNSIPVSSSIVASVPEIGVTVATSIDVSDTAKMAAPKLESDFVPGYVESGLQKQFPKYIAFADDPTSKARISYRTLNERLGEVLNIFAAPVYPALVRQPSSSDFAGGTFLSRRSDLGKSDDAIFARDALGRDARRIHGGTDFLSIPGQPVLAPMSGTIDKEKPFFHANKQHMGIRIVAKDGTMARVLYVSPDSTLRAGDTVTAGETRLGVAVDITGIYPKTPNHVHVDFTDVAGRRFDPWTNSVLDPLP